MQLQFHKSDVSCLQRVVDQVQNQEQTQELRLPENMPDIGSVLASWGQCVIRSKEWRGNTMTASGGVMVWVLYEPEGGGTPCALETWIPFQMKWNIADTENDGIMQIVCMTRFVDARSVSARKLMIRVGVCAQAEAFCNSKMEIYTPTELPEDIQLLKNTYPLCLPAEAGEKAFALEEDLTLPASGGKIEKIIYYSLHPEIIDKKVMAGKAVFRGSAVLHILYQGDDGKMHNWDFEIPFSQFTELDRDYEQDTQMKITPALTGLELELDQEGLLHLKAGITAQYVVYTCQMTEVVEDAYSPTRVVTLQKEYQTLPMLLDMQTDTVRAEATSQMDAETVADVAFYPQCPQLVLEDENMMAQMSAEFQGICYDDLGEAHGFKGRWEDQWSIPADMDTTSCVQLAVTGNPQAVASADSIQMRGDIALDIQTYARGGLEMVIGLELGQEKRCDDVRPSLIVCKAGTDSLWQIAKENSTTQEAIRQANNLQGEPDPEQLLLIPII